MDPLLALAAVAGLGWGLVADRIAARWPAHEDGSIRGLDWRTIAVGVAGATAAGRLAAQFGDDPTALAFLGPVIVVLIALFATDLDQRLLPDRLTLPIAAWALVGFVVGAGPFVRTPGDLGWAALASVALPLALFAVSIPFGAGAIGIGDLKLLVGVGLIIGALRIVAGVVLGAVLAAIVILGLLAARRISLKSYVPYGPFLIAGALWAMLATPPG